MAAPKEVQPTGEFECQLCGLTAPYTYYGPKPPNSRAVVLLEEAYVMKDPFTPDQDRFLIVGSHCSLCCRSVCVGTERIGNTDTFWTNLSTLSYLHAQIKCPEFMKDSIDISKCGSSVCQKRSIPASRDLCTQYTFLNEGQSKYLLYAQQLLYFAVKSSEKSHQLEFWYQECSLFYSKRFCLPCVKANLKAFPLEIQEDMDKRKPQQKSCKKTASKT